MFKNIFQLCKLNAGEQILRPHTTSDRTYQINGTHSRYYMITKWDFEECQIRATNGIRLIYIFCYGANDRITIFLQKGRYKVVHETCLFSIKKEEYICVCLQYNIYTTETKLYNLKHKELKLLKMIKYKGHRTRKHIYVSVPYFTVHI